MSLNIGGMDAMQSSTKLFDFGAIDGALRRDVAGCRVFTGRDAAQTGKPAFMFVAGAFHGAWCYVNYLNYFASHDIDCFAIDLPGHGTLAAPTPALDLGIHDLGAQLAQACRALDRPLVLVGHSMGALPVMLAAEQLPLAGLVLLAPSPPGNLPGALALPEVAAGRIKAPPDAAEVAKRFLAVSPDRDIRPVIERLTPETPAIMNDRYLLRVTIDPARIQCPGICFEAERDDPDRHPAGQDEAVARFLGLSYQLLSNQPHCMMYADRWRESAAELQTWYRKTFR
jgi:pimeloyl-ACP methyl ester carboxylesterase